MQSVRVRTVLVPVLLPPAPPREQGCLRDRNRPTLRWLKAALQGYVLIASSLLSTALLVALLDPWTSMLTNPFSDDLNSIPYYAKQEWTSQFMHDQNQIGSSRSRYTPFTVWRRPAYQSLTVKVNSAGERIVPDSSQEESALKVWFFGGSTMWGTSSPDWGTIPACFQKFAMAHLDRPVQTRNLGESAWVSSQSVIALMQELQRGHHPDYVIFYEGANDLAVSFRNSQPYRHAEFERIASKFNRIGRGRGQVRAVSRSWEDLFSFIAPHLTVNWQTSQFNTGWPVDDSEFGLTRLAQETVHVCLENQRVVRALGKEYGFDVHFFWQPFLIYDRKPLAAGEAAILARATPWAETFRPFARAANAEVERHVGEHFTDLSHCFATVESQLYTDMVHVTPEANELVARAIYETVEEKLRTRPARMMEGERPGSSRP